jgi:hypothetical protein
MCLKDRFQNQKYQDGRSSLKINFKTSVDFTNIIEPSKTDNIVRRELAITGALKFENCKFKNCHFTVTAVKENK